MNLHGERQWVSCGGMKKKSLCGGKLRKYRRRERL